MQGALQNDNGGSSYVDTFSITSSRITLVRKASADSSMTDKAADTWSGMSQKAASRTEATGESYSVEAMVTAKEFQGKTDQHVWWDFRMAMGKLWEVH